MRESGNFLVTYFIWEGGISEGGRGMNYFMENIYPCMQSKHGCLTEKDATRPKNHNVSNNQQPEKSDMLSVDDFSCGISMSQVFFCICILPENLIS